MDKFSFACRTNWCREPNRLNKALEDLESRHMAVLDLTASNPTVCGFQYPEGILTAFNAAENLCYKPDACGLVQARQAVSDYYARQEIVIAPKDIILTASTSEAYSFLLRLLVNPGEKVLIPKPSYPLFQFLLEINDVQFDYYPLIYEGQWHLDLQALERLVDSNTRAVILVNPNNPTGSYLGAGELVFLNEFCRKHHLSIISDEVFFEYAWNPGDFVSCAGNQEVLTFALGGLSKSLCLPQMKCSWILASGPQALKQDALDRLEIIADTYLSVNTPVQHALSAWLDGAGDIQRQIIARVKQNGQWLADNIGDHTQILSLQGGWYATLRIPAVKSEEEWALAFAQEDHVLVYPGYFFDMPDGTYIVLSLLPPASIFQEAAGRIIKRLAEI
jgi:hypothetical protein